MNNRAWKILALGISIVILTAPIQSNAHPGNTAGDGCHYCRTRCDYWGEVYNARHCHGGSPAPQPYTPPQPAPFSKYFDGKLYTNEAEYNRAVAEKVFRDEHTENIETLIEDTFERGASEAEVAEWFNFSTDILAIEAALKNSDEYREIEFEKEHKANIENLYEGVYGAAPSDSQVEELFEFSRDLEQIESHLTEARNQEMKSEVAEDTPDNAQQPTETPAKDDSGGSFFDWAILAALFGIPAYFLNRRLGRKR